MPPLMTSDLNLKMLMVHSVQSLPVFSCPKVTKVWASFLLQSSELVQCLTPMLWVDFGGTRTQWEALSHRLPRSLSFKSPWEWSGALEGLVLFSRNAVGFPDTHHLFGRFPVLNFVSSRTCPISPLPVRAPVVSGMLDHSPHTLLQENFSQSGVDMHDG